MFKKVGKKVLAYCNYVGLVAFVGVSTMTVQVYILKVIVKCTEDAQASGYQGDTGGDVFTCCAFCRMNKKRCLTAIKANPCTA